MKQLVLCGGGHAHLFVLQKLAQQPRSDIQVTLISPGEWQYYSGMLPGWMAGLYTQEQCRLHLPSLAQRAGVQLIDSRVSHIDAAQRRLTLDNGQCIAFDVLSLDIGSHTETRQLHDLGDKLISIKPLDAFQHAWSGILRTAANQARYTLAIVGAGAAGVELAFAARAALNKTHKHNNIYLIAGQNGLLAQHNAGVRHQTERALQEAGIKLIQQRASGRADGLLLNDGSLLAVDHVIAASGARAPQWLTHSDLALDADGYIAVDACHRNLAHPHIFAAGDICSRSDVKLDRSGVHAVRAGPVLANNLYAALDQAPCQPFMPRTRSLYLLSCSDGYAIASWGKLSASGRWVWRWKDAIDRRFIQRFSQGK